MMRLRVLAGLLGLGLSLGGLFNLYCQAAYAPPLPNDPIVDEYVRVVGQLYAKGDSLPATEARLAVLGSRNVSSLTSQIASAASTADAGLGQPSAGFVAVASTLEPVDAVTAPRLSASGRGSLPLASTRGEESSANQAIATEFPVSGRVSATKGDASLRTKPALNGPVLRIIPRGSEVVLLGVEYGQPVEGAEDRWYRVRHAEVSGYIYSTLIEPAR